MGACDCPDCSASRSPVDSNHPERNPGSRPHGPLFPRLTQAPSSWRGPLDTSAPAPSPSVVPVPAADPVAAVDAFLDAVVAKEWDSLPSLACAAERDNVASFFSTGDATSNPFLDAMQVSISDRSVTLKDSSGVHRRS